MQQIYAPDCGYDSFAGFNPVVGSMREISDAEIEQVSGGVLPLIIAGARFAAGAFVGAFAARAGAALFDHFYLSEDAPCQ